MEEMIEGAGSGSLALACCRQRRGGDSGAEEVGGAGGGREGDDAENGRGQSGWLRVRGDAA
jgi:hypothetical protein